MAGPNTKDIFQTQIYLHSEVYYSIALFAIINKHYGNETNDEMNKILNSSLVNIDTSLKQEEYFNTFISRLEFYLEDSMKITSSSSIKSIKIKKNLSEQKFILKIPYSLKDKINTQQTKIKDSFNFRISMSDFVNFSVVMYVQKNRELFEKAFQEFLEIPLFLKKDFQSDSKEQKDKELEQMAQSIKNFITSKNIEE